MDVIRAECIHMYGKRQSTSETDETSSSKVTCNSCIEMAVSTGLILSKIDDGNVVMVIQLCLGLMSMIGLAWSYSRRA